MVNMYITAVKFGILDISQVPTVYRDIVTAALEEN